MSEKRFVQCEIEYGFANTTNIKKVDGIYDMQEEKTYRIEQIVDLLNEQQATITKLKELNDDKGKRIISLIRTNKTLKEENEQLRKELGDCEKFRYTVFKRLNDEHIKECSIK